MQTLMLIEDDETFVSIFERYFVAGGYRVTACGAVEEALAAWRKGAPDLVVANCRLIGEVGPRGRSPRTRDARAGIAR